MREENQRKSDATKELPVVKKIYNIVIVCLYQLLGAYFIYFSTFSEERGALLPSWVYAAFGCLMIVYGISRIYRFCKRNDKIEKQD